MARYLVSITNKYSSSDYNYIHEPLTGCGIQDSQVQTQLSAVIFQEVKNLSTSPLGGTLRYSSRNRIFSGSLKNLKPEKIGSEQNVIIIIT